METYSENLKCPLCQERDLVFLFRSKDYITLDTFSVYQCSRCGLSVTDLPISGGLENRYYGKGYYGKRKSFTENIINYARVIVVSRFVDFARHLSLLDVGCGNGTFLMSLRKRGWLSFGTDVAPLDHFRGGAEEFISRGDFKNIDFAVDSFDVVTMWHFLEHVGDPLGCLAKVRKILKQDGLLLVEVPNFDSWQARFFKGNWFHLDVPRHIIHFSPKSADILLQKAGFNKIKISSGSFIYGYFGYMQSILNSVSARKNLFFDFLNNKINLKSIFYGHSKDLFLNIIFFIPALIVSLVLSLGEILAGKSGIILISASK